MIWIHLKFAKKYFFLKSPDLIAKKKLWISWNNFWCHYSFTSRRLTEKECQIDHWLWNVSWIRLFFYLVKNFICPFFKTEMILIRFSCIFRGKKTFANMFEWFCSFKISHWKKIFCFRNFFIRKLKFLAFWQSPVKFKTLWAWLLIFL